MTLSMCVTRPQYLARGLSCPARNADPLLFVGVLDVVPSAVTPPPRLPFQRSVSMPVRYTAGVSAFSYSPRNIFRFYFFCFAL